MQSPKTLKKYLKSLNPSLVVLFPDAGAVNNENVADANFDTIVFLIKNQYKVKIAWWSQYHKPTKFAPTIPYNERDIDELTRSMMSHVRLISPLEFYNRHSNECKQRLQRWLPDNFIDVLKYLNKD